ncbi:hypothetical protein ACROYT_G029831 [Oculina patagonica]
MANWHVRDAVSEDAPDILRMVKDLAAESDSEVKLTEEDLLRDGFGEKPCFGSLIAEELCFTEGNNCLTKKKAVGFALYFYIYSTWEGRCLYMQDLYVDPAFRGKGIGTELLKRVSTVAVENSCARVDWGVLNWNKAAKDFYDKRGAVCLEEWRLFRLTRESLVELTGKKN